MKRRDSRTKPLLCTKTETDSSKSAILVILPLLNWGPKIVVSENSIQRNPTGIALVKAPRVAMHTDELYILVVGPCALT